MAAKRKIEPPDEFSRDEKNVILRWHRKMWPHHFVESSVRKRFVSMEIDSCLDWHRGEGISRWKADYLAAVRNWIRKSMERKGYEPYAPPSSKPSARGRNPFEKTTGPLEPLSSSIPPMLAAMYGRRN